MIATLLQQHSNNDAQNHAQFFSTLILIFFISEAFETAINEDSFSYIMFFTKTQVLFLIDN